jgi:putative tryptophan/tyrosine transport system substrate-binding protein
MRRREFIAGIGIAAAWRLAAHAQQRAPVIGFLSNASPAVYALRLSAFRRGLQETGFVEGQNVAIEYRWANGENARLPALATELVNRGVAVIVAGGGTPAAMAAKAVVTTIPVVFEVAVDPVEVGLVPSLNHPGGNLTGITNMNVEMGPKKLEVVRELLPAATRVAVLLNPSSPLISQPFLSQLQPAAKALGIQLDVVQASKDSDLEPAFAKVKDDLKADAVVMAPDIFYNMRTEQIAKLALRHTVPVIQTNRSFVAAGGLISHGSDESEYYRLVGTYAGRILKGDKPGDLPVQRSTKVELIINLTTAKALGISVPLSLLGRADELIE